jgi:RNA 2',3'-cyclic 3'-phosphodiesterase
MRAFLAFETSPSVVDALLEAEEGLRRTGADVKLVERENLHFTVKFLGEVPETIVPEIDRRVGALSLPKMEVGVVGLGAFPDAGRPRIVWAGVAPRDEPVFSKSAQLVIDALQGIGQSDDRRYHPHITVARVRSPRNVAALAGAIRADASKEFGRSEVTVLKLKSSTLTPSGPIYRDVREYPLQ